MIIISHVSGSYVRHLPWSKLPVPLDNKSSTEPQQLWLDQYKKQKHYLQVLIKKNYCLAFALQVHISLSGNNHMRISCMTKDDTVSSIVDYGTSSGK